MNLADLPERVGGFDAELDWGHLLSLGEQQRLAFARLLLARPGYAVLDEATSALDEPNEALLYRELQNAGDDLHQRGTPAEPAGLPRSGARTPGRGELAPEGSLKDRSLDASSTALIHHQFQPTHPLSQNRLRLASIHWASSLTYKPTFPYTQPT